MKLTTKERRETDVLIRLNTLQDAFVALAATTNGLYSAGKDMDVGRYRAKQEALLANIEDLREANDAVLSRLIRLTEEL